MPVARAPCVMTWKPEENALSADEQGRGRGHQGETKTGGTRTR